MKIRNIIIIAMGAMLMFLAASCEDGFLKQDPQTTLSSDQVFSKPENVQAFVYGLYYKWRDTRVNRKGFYMILGTDEAQQGEYQVRTDAMQAAFDKYDGYYDSENTSIAQAWNIRWPVAIQASEGLYHVQGQMEGNSQYQLFFGQISFYRACVLFELTQYWGKIPLPNIVDGENQLGPRKELPEVYKMITEDLTSAIKYLPEKWPSDGRIPTTWAARMMLAKVYMAAPESSGYRDFSKALTLLKEIKDSGAFSLVSDYGSLFDAAKIGGELPSEHSSEEIFTFYFNNVWPDCTEAQWYTGSRACSGDPDCMYGGYDLVLPTDYCVNNYESGDTRKDANIRTNFIYNGKQPTAAAGFGEDQLNPHFKKFEDSRIDGTKSFYYTGTNMYYLRYADALLMLAECMNETGDTPGAVELVNTTVRARAFGGSVPVAFQWSTGMSQADFRVKIMDERMRELAAEGWRRIDLARTGNFETYISARNRWQIGSPTVTQNHRLFPIPNVEIKQNKYMQGDQNPGLN